MKIPSFTLLRVVGLLTLVIGITGALLWFANRPAVDRLEDPNCFEMAGAEKSIVRCTQTKAASLCELVKNPERYDYKIVRVKAIIFGYHHQHLYDPACHNDGTLTWVDYGSPDLIGKMMTAIVALKDERSDRGYTWASVVLAGRFEERQSGDPVSEADDPGFQQIHQVRDKFRFVIMNVERVEAVGQEVSWPK